MTSESALVSGLAKATRRLIPFMSLLFLISFIDRSNVSFAALSMNKDLGFTPTIYAWGVGFFFFGYVLFEVPSNMILEKIGARRWIAPIVIAWGIASVALAWAGDAKSFFTLRFLLGMAEAGLLPGLLLYMTWWFPANRRARTTALLMLAIPLSIVIGGPLSGIILGIPGLDGAMGFKSWQWLFIIEGIPAVLVGLMVYKLMPDRPADASWLTAEEKAALDAELDREGRAQASHAHGSTLIEGLVSPPVLLLSLAYFGSLLGGFGIIFWVPQIVKAFGLSNVQTGFVAAIPYAAAVVAMVVLGRIGDKTGKRVALVVGPAIAGAIGLIGAGLTSDPVLSILALSLAASGIYGLLPSFWTLPPTYLKGTAVAAAFATVNSIGALGGFVGPYLVGWAKETTGSFSTGLILIGCGALVNAAAVLILSKVMPRNHA
jgi:ACS family tartrate transporter-like MFS transporter